MRCSISVRVQRRRHGAGDPDLVLQDGWLKVFTVLYMLIGIGVLVEILRRLGTAFVVVRAQDKGH